MRGKGVGDRDKAIETCELCEEKPVAGPGVIRVVGDGIYDVLLE